MYAGKHARSSSSADMHSEIKKVNSTSTKARLLEQGEPSAKRHIPSPPAFVSSPPIVLVFTMLSVIGYWRLSPGLPDSVKAVVDVQQSVPGFAPPPPTLPKSVPSHIKAPVDAASRAAKMAWLTETKRADLAGAEISDDNLNKMYKQARKWYSRHAKATEVHALHRTRTRCLTCVWIYHLTCP